MKIIKTASGKKNIKISKSEWQSIGKKAGWINNKVSKDNISNFDEVEKEHLLNFGESLVESDRGDGLVKQDSEYNIRDNIATFVTKGSNAISTQHETYWEPFKWGALVEKIAPSVFYVKINDKTSEVDSLQDVIGMLEAG